MTIQSMSLIQTLRFSLQWGTIQGALTFGFIQNKVVKIIRLNWFASVHQTLVFFSVAMPPLSLVHTELS